MELSRRPLEKQRGAQERQDQSPDSGEKPWPVPGRMGSPGRARAAREGAERASTARGASSGLAMTLPGENRASRPVAMSCAQSAASSQRRTRSSVSLDQGPKPGEAGSKCQCLSHWPSDLLAFSFPSPSGKKTTLGRFSPRRSLIPPEFSIHLPL